MAGGFVVGVFMGKLLAFILQRVQHNIMVTLSFMLLMPFVTYLLAETLHVSGVIAVVVLGLGIARFSNKILPGDIRRQSKTIWDMILFLLNGLIFILIGLEFPLVARSIDKDLLLPYIGYAAIITVAALILRMARVLLQRVNLHRAFRQKKGKIKEEALLSLQDCLIISWSGMRGIVSLAIAIGLPEKLENGKPFPQRNAIIFISVVVVLMTLIGQGISLPWVVKALHKVRSRHSAT